MQRPNPEGGEEPSRAFVSFDTFSFVCLTHLKVFFHAIWRFRCSSPHMLGSHSMLAMTELQDCVTVKRQELSGLMHHGNTIALYLGLWECWALMATLSSALVEPVWRRLECLFFTTFCEGVATCLGFHFISILKIKSVWFFIHSIHLGGLLFCKPAATELTRNIRKQITHWHREMWKRSNVN